MLHTRQELRLAAMTKAHQANVSITQLGITVLIFETRMETRFMLYTAVTCRKVLPKPCTLAASVELLESRGPSLGYPQEQL
jgi:hypothetical protein